MADKSPDFFTKEAAQGYDEKNRKLSRIADCLHFLIGLVLKDLPPRSRILCVGAGTGAEVLALAQAFPESTFVALDPSLGMLDICRERIERAGVADRCELIHGYIQDLPGEPMFDAVLSVLVAHFVPREERSNFFKEMTSRLRKDGTLVNIEISYDLDSNEFPSMLRSWEEVQTLMGATREALDSLPKQLREILTVLSPTETEALIRENGIDCPVRFFQALMIHGWYGKKGI
ncbi:SAM-dependent methyltransferase [Geomesophilobacter sediminis]|uniref:Class I SAM-dependent methyltransferase n=1 Tax=Geomesophilobacter sediminis TaxID=2798584 RepID=A0A8J7J0X1_9BACT|nr:class I SAM-dependent methyltransferase [Geomesophilobacter sediminis]MBJ6724153.1 class I SAM-dependent methyltransferase [Geomesophilobacter sediminis]